MNAHSESKRLSLGAYVLGTLEPAEAGEMESHLAGCSACLAELAELQVVLPSLAILTPEDVSPPALSPEVFDRIAAVVRADGVAERRRRSRRWLLVAAAAALIAGGGTAAGLAITSSAPSATVASAESGVVRLRVSASDDGPGTKLVLTAQGLPAHERCTLLARATDGSVHAAGAWAADYDGHATVTETTDVPRSRLTSVTLYGSGGNRLVTVRLQG